MTLLHDAPARRSCTTLLHDAPARRSCTTLLHDAPARRSCMGLLHDTRGHTLAATRRGGMSRECRRLSVQARVRSVPRQREASPEIVQRRAALGRRAFFTAKTAPRIQRGAPPV